MQVIYKNSTNAQFGTDENYKLIVDSSNKHVQWTIYAHAPKDMHWKAADQYGLGGEHFREKQSYEDFYENPKYDIHAIKKEFIYLLINDSKDIEEVARQMNDLSSSNRINIKKEDYISIVIYQVDIDDISLNISCKNQEDIAKIDMLCEFL